MSQSLNKYILWNALHRIVTAFASQISLNQIWAMTATICRIHDPAFPRITPSLNTREQPFSSILRIAQCFSLCFLRARENWHLFWESVHSTEEKIFRCLIRLDWTINLLDSIVTAFLMDTRCWLHPAFRVSHIFIADFTFSSGLFVLLQHLKLKTDVTPKGTWNW